MDRDIPDRFVDLGRLSVRVHIGRMGARCCPFCEQSEVHIVHVVPSLRATALDDMKLTTRPTGVLPATGYIRQVQIIGVHAVTPEQADANRKRGKGPRRSRPGIAPIVPVSSATFWRKVKAGEFPAPVKLSERVTAWRCEDVREWLDAQAAK